MSKRQKPRGSKAASPTRTNPAAARPTTPAAAETRLPSPAVMEFRIPIAVDIPAGVYVSKHVEARLDADQAAALRRLWTGLDNDGARLKNGKRVGSNADVIRYILEQVPPANG